MSSNSMEYAKGLAGFPPTGSPYNTAGYVTRKAQEYSRPSSYSSDEQHSSGTELASSVSSESGKTDDYVPHENAFQGVPFEGLLGQMPDGSVAWTTPWSIMYDKATNTLWMDPDGRVSDSEGGTVQVDLAKIGDNYFINSDDVESHGEEFISAGELQAMDEGYVRLYSSESEVIKATIAKNLEKLDVSKVPSLIAHIIQELRGKN